MSDIIESKILDGLKSVDKLDFSVGNIVTVTEGKYKGIGLKLMEIKENGICTLRVSPDNEVTIEIEFDKIKSLASFEEEYAKTIKESVLGVIGGKTIH